MSRLRNGLGGFLLITSLIFALALPAFAAEFPNKPINLIIPYPPGGSIDLPSRALANGTGKRLGQPIICENKAGGGGSVGPSIVISKPPDGYTLGIITSSPTIAYHMGKLNFNPVEDVTHIMRWGANPFGIVVRSDSQWKTIQDLLQYAKQNPKKVTYGSPGVGTPPNLAMEELGLAAGIEWTHMPYKGVAENNAALLGGHIDVISDSSGWAPLVDAGKFRLLATWGSQRLSRYPQVPSVKETGYNVVSSGIVAVMGPKGIPKPIVQRVHEAFHKAMDDPEFQAVMAKFDMGNLYLNTENYEEFVRQDFEKIGKLVKTLGLDKK
jgi:tripartite-type tricarboxylate transporter receptor subunit TctC